MAARHRARRRRPSSLAKQKRRLSAARKGFHAFRLPTLTLLRSGSGVCGYPHSQRPLVGRSPVVFSCVQILAEAASDTKRTKPVSGLALDRPLGVVWLRGFAILRVADHCDAAP